MPPKPLTRHKSIGLVVRRVHSPITLSDWYWSAARAQDPPTCASTAGPHRAEMACMIGHYVA
jgi:hypothetical protein